METNEQTTPEIDKAALLKVAGKVQSGKKLEKFDPMARIPTLEVGDLTAGQMIAGTLVRFEQVPTPNSQYATDKNELGVKTSPRIILRVADGSLLGLWATRELRAVFEQRPVGGYITITYKGKGENAKGNQQHFFEYSEEAAVLNS